MRPAEVVQPKRDLLLAAELAPDRLRLFDQRNGGFAIALARRELPGG